jgi:hypothetical protein
MAHAGPPVRIGIGIGFGVPYYRPYYPYYYGNPYGYYPYVVPASPIVVQAPPVVYQSGTVVATTPTPAQVYSSPQINTVEPALVQPPNQNAQPVNAQLGFEFHVARLNNQDEAQRRESVMELGRMKNERAIDPLAATLAGDKSASVREAAARALGIVGSPRALPALIHAAQADNDRDVRHSAQFAVEIIRANIQR